jgi:hypothetical protein
VVPPPLVVSKSSSISIIVSYSGAFVVLLAVPVVPAENLGADIFVTSTRSCAEQPRPCSY